ncbi:MAG: polysaccharide deacetylase family protein, partial [Bifidobacteriaceae bacterium]|jgi:peptidoglycan/xylan/chitin deacetylase (PgdA/CDA1 family)|nr:polysaccharide deacetylase family protein [Bifidobacteriaceae bacterium]
VKCAALTFDDGPSDHTRRYLEILERHDAVATFFVIGSQVANRSGVLKKAAYQGNEIASHTWDHRALTSLTEGQIRSEVRRTAREIEKATGVRPALVRPPYGRIDGRVAGVLGSVGAAAILWSVDTRDWEHRNGAKVLRSVERHTQRGAIVLMHDLHSASADALDEMIQTLEDRGYTLVTVSEILGGNPKPGKIYRAGLK